ncbi:MAG: hypothetical protein COB60_07145 [Flavobacteriaceae bacterium]|nr:MAG: hypothetical protein COB60_07145 [Flavobacteriaceae bacterium]
MKTIILIFSMVFTLASCNSNEAEKQNDSLIGAWEEVSPCKSCSTITIKNDGTILLKPYSSLEDLRMTFTFNGDYMEVNRLWLVGDDKESNIVQVNFKSNDTLELLQFRATDANSVTGFEDVTFKKN